MRRRVASFLLLAAAAVANAQEGFPLDGTWRGQLQGASGAPVTVVMVMQWDGKAITGVINPGAKSVPIGQATLVPEGWRVTLLAQSKDGKPIAFEGAIENLGAYDRVIAGTWTEGGQKYSVRMVRE